MRAQRWLLAATLATLLPGCAPDGQTPRAALDMVKGLPPVDRRAVIKSKLARVCPAPLSDAELERAASYVEANAASLEAAWIVGRLDRFDAETRICRGAK